MALGHDLRADQDVGAAGGDRRQQAFPLFARACGITIHTQYTRLREQLGQARLDTLRAAAKGLNVLIATAGAGARHGAIAAAVVTTQTAVDQVHDQVGGTVWAATHPTAGRA